MAFVFSFKFQDIILFSNEELKDLFSEDGQIDMLKYTLLIYLHVSTWY